MDSNFLTNLLLFNNIIQPELMRSVHVYRQCGSGADGEEETQVEREFLFSRNSYYVEMQATPILQLQKSAVSRVREGYRNGVWDCIFAFHAAHAPQFSRIPSLLLFTRNPKLMTIPNLLNDLQMIYTLNVKEEDIDVTQEELQGNNNDCLPSESALPKRDLDLNCLPYEEDESELQNNEIEVESLTGLVGKKKRTPSHHVANIAYSDLVKYFDMPIVEASRKLNIGLTVLKKKCRELGIPRWPHRKIKSLDSLIHDLQEMAKHQELEDKAAAMTVIQRQKMLESEKENIEKQPFIDIQSETKRFRQDIFKRRYRARAIERQNSAVSSS